MPFLLLNCFLFSCARNSHWFEKTAEWQPAAIELASKCVLLPETESLRLSPALFATMAEVEVKAPWGRWQQSIDEVGSQRTLLCLHHTIDRSLSSSLYLPTREQSRSRSPLRFLFLVLTPRKVTCTASSISVKAADASLLSARWHLPVVADDMIWTLDDGVLVIEVPKSTREASSVWPSLFADGAEACLALTIQLIILSRQHRPHRRSLTQSTSR